MSASRLPGEMRGGLRDVVTVQLNAEAHSSASRAGFSVIVLGDDKLGIELSFWTNSVLALGDDPLFYAAESTNFVTTGTLVSYALTLQATKNTLSANGTIILSGRVRNYTAFSGPANPYETPNYLFLRDNTTSAAAAFKRRQVALLFAPALAAPAPGVVTWTGVSNQAYTVQGSATLVSWITLGTATSVKDAVAFTNSPAVAGHFFEWCCRDRATGQITRLFVHG